MKKFLTNLIAKRKAEMEDLKKRMKASNDADEVRSIGDTLIALRDEITDAENQLAELDNEGEDEPADPAADEAKSRSKNPMGGLNPMAAFGQSAPQERGSENPRSSMEYRQAFMAYVQRGVKSDVLQYRSDDQNESTDLGVLLPETIVQEIIKGVEKVYGQLYSRVKKTNIKGGVKYPIGAFSATFNRIYEVAGSDNNPVAPTERQNGGSVTGYVEFSYKLGEVRLAQTLLASVLTVPVFENELAKVIIEAYVKAMDTEILTGDPDDGEMEGILTEAAKSQGGRLKGQIIEFTAEDMADWKQWQKKLFAKIPLAMRAAAPQFVMTANTYESNIKTLHDENNRPVYNETFNPVDGAERATFKGKEVVFVEEGLGFENFDDATNGEYFGMYWIPEKGYAINTNLEFAVKRYFDEEKLQWVDRAVVINDGKILDPKYIYLLKKKVTG